MKDDDGRCIVYETPDKQVVAIPVPKEALMPTADGDMKLVTINTRLDAMLWLKSEMELAGDSMKNYRIIKTKGFAPSKTELVTREHDRLFGGRG